MWNNLSILAQCRESLQLGGGGQGLNSLVNLAEVFQVETIRKWFKGSFCKFLNDCS
uniref:Uncharacterized protein n=1 Tax=Arundo donax TaxID=35708 RepID=A0A0A9BX35_ARUDO